MSIFDITGAPLDNMFVKHDSGILKNIYGTTDITPYWVADMDFAVAPSITEELQRLVDRGVYSYEFNSQGVFNSLSKWYQQRHDLTLKLSNFVQAPGVLSGIALLIDKFTEPGDGILIQTPAYHQFENLIGKAERKVITNPLLINNGKYELDYKDFELKLKNKNVKAVLLCNPHNPTGRVWKREELQKLINIAEQYNTLIISDEIHSEITFKGHPFNSLMSFDYDKSIALLGSPAKTFGMHSISTGYIYTENNTLFNQTKDLMSGLYLDHGNAFSTFATIAAYEHGSDWLDELIKYLESSVDWIDNFIQNEMPKVKMFRPEGTYQIWFDFSDLALDDESLKAAVFQQAKFGLTPGSWFGADSSQFMRINIATPLAGIQESFMRLNSTLKNIE